MVLLLTCLFVNAFIPQAVEGGEIPTGGTLVLTLYFDVDSLNVFTMSADPSFRVCEKMYDTLFLVLTNGTYYPWLAESWSVSEDAMSFTFKLRQGVKWHDGKPFTSADVKYTFDLAKGNPSLDNFALAVSSLESVEAPDNYTVVFHLNEPLVSFLFYAGGACPIVPKHIWENIADPATFEPMEDTKTLIGTGPFKFVSRVPGEQIVLEANDDFWTGRPYVDSIIFKVYTNADARVLALLKGEVDGAGSIPSNLIGSLIGQKDVIVIKRPSLQANNWMGFNLRVYPLNLREVRQAFDYAIDKDFIYSNVEMGIAEHGNDGCVTPALAEWLHPDGALWKGAGMTEEQRIAAANKLLDDLGFLPGADGIRVAQNGTRLQFELLTLSAIPDYVRAAEVIKENLKPVGIEIDVRSMETNTVINIVYGSPVGEYDLYIMGCGYEADPDACLYLEFYSDPPIPQWTADAQAYGNSTLNELLKQQRVEPDLQKRKELIWDIQEILADDLPMVVLFHRVGIVAHRTDRFEGWDDEQGIYSQFTSLNVHLIPPPEEPEPEIVEKIVEKEVIPTWAYAAIAVAAVAVIASVYIFTRK
jgi:peptide/nickel transport system substrate-binding protein